ncbi:hypothetical protein PRIPAC_85136 [Pristionchus pacificus]|uniref:Uncharacterized protein n=1 Tax=Pristionchus pacificus TaxID=54126 RepID=A0A2A6BUH2_PRIPA|nr:hypothetical protein PRIPAC_85136 [Pristionchus pacificus]|eukprot:PDM69564.1 hypothetical protein PRIPAC_44660 [Pristionchus pacificus]
MVTSSEVSRSKEGTNQSINRSICAGRCVCLHAFSQWATLALESLLLHHGLLSAPLSLMEKGEKETEGGERVRDALRRAMKGRRHEDVREIVVCFGASPLLVHRVYRLPVNVCCEEEREKEMGEEDDEERTQCGSPCAALNAAEQRKINRHLFTMFPPEASTGKTQRVYIVVRGSERLMSEEMTEVEGVSRAKDGEITVEWSHSGCGRRMNEEEEVKRDEESIHMRLRQFIILAHYEYFFKTYHRRFMSNQVDADAAKLMKSLVALGLQASNAPPTATGATAAAAATTARHKANIQQDEKSQPVYRSNEYPSTGELTESGSEPESSSDTSRRRPKAAIDGGKKQTAIRVSGTNGTAAPPKAAPKKAAKAVPVKKSTTAVPVKKKSTAVPVKVTKKTQKRR